ncbi:MFS transporter [Sphingomonas sp. ASV193]|uniref:MFS transporter n=1 Tax=Sphingomonas sp. ASV193 TaxID=3144405 RepID=UPI0032E85FB8
MSRDDPKRPAPGWTLAMSIAASSLSFIDGSVLNVALPALRQSLNAGAADVQWVVNAYTLPLAALILTGGALGDHQGRRRWLVIGTALFGLASLVCAVGNSLALLLAGRALQGVGAALLLPNSLALLNSAYHGEARGRAVGIWAAAGAISAAIAPLIGGWLVAHAGWRAIFYINLPIAAAAIAIALAKVTEVKERKPSRLDAVGAILATLALLGLTYGLTLWSADRALGPTAPFALGAGLGLAIAFGWAEWRRGDKAMIPLAYFRDRAFVALNLLTFLLYGAFGVSMLLIPYVLIDAGGYSPVEGGLALLPLSILMGLLSPLMGKLAQRVGPHWPLTIGPLLIAAAFLLATRIAADQHYWPSVFPAMALMAAGMTIAVAPLTSAVLASVDAEHTGMVSGFNSALSRTGGLIATALIGGVLGAEGKGLLHAFAGAMVVSAAVAAAASVTAFVGLAGKKGKPSG